MTRSLELNALEAMRRLVHLEKNYHGHVAERLPVQNDVGVTVAKVESPGQPDCAVTVLLEQLV